MKWTSRKDHEMALARYKNAMSYTGKFGTLEEQRVLYNEYNEVWENYKLTKGLKKIIFILLVVVSSFVGHKIYNHINGVEEVNSCSINNTCNYKNQY